MAKTKSESGFDADAILQQLEDAKGKALKPLEEAIRQQEEIRDQAEAEIQQLQKLHDRVSGRSSKGTSAGGRVRRSRSALEAEAKAIVDFARSRKQGVSGAEIRERFPKVPTGLKDFVQKYGGKLTSTGAKAGMKYHAD